MSEKTVRKRSNGIGGRLGTVQPRPLFRSTYFLLLQKITETVTEDAEKLRQEHIFIKIN